VDANYQSTQIRQLLAALKGRTSVTFEELLERLPRLGTTGSKFFDRVLSALSEEGVELVDEVASEHASSPRAVSSSGVDAEELAIRKLDDPIRMYFSQMSQIPLLTREEEIMLAKEIEASRNRLRELIFATHMGQKRAVEILELLLEKELLIEKALDVNLSRKGERGEFFVMMRRATKSIRANLDRMQEDFQKLEQRPRSSSETQALKRGLQRHIKANLRTIEKFHIKMKYLTRWKGALLKLAADLRQAVADEHQRARLVEELPDALGRLLAEPPVAHAERFVDEQDPRAHRRGDGEVQARPHARRVRA